MLYLALFLGLSWTAYTLFTRTRTGESAIATHEDGSAVANDDGTQQYGLNAQPDLTGIIKLADLPPGFLPQTGKHRHTGRLVIVGDVHGMKDALVDLLGKINFNSKHDHLILAGDMISKGPDSPGVVDLAMKLGATGVRGNHEDRILLAHADMEAKHLSMDAPGPSENKEKGQDGLEEESFNHGDYKDRKLARELGEHRIKWLKKCPVILRVGKLGSLGEVVVVHAGLAPGVKLEMQDPVMVMNMRTMKDGVPSNEREGHPWQRVWSSTIHSSRSKDTNFRLTAGLEQASKKPTKERQDVSYLRTRFQARTCDRGLQHGHRYRLLEGWKTYRRCHRRRPFRPHAQSCTRELQRWESVRDETAYIGVYFDFDPP